MTLKHNDKDVKGNYSIASAGVVTEFEVNEGKYFTDVLPGDWFYNEVYKAKNKGYVHGIGDTKMRRRLHGSHAHGRRRPRLPR